MSENAICGSKGDYSLSCTLDRGHEGACYDESQPVEANMVGWTSSPSRLPVAEATPRRDDFCKHCTERIRRVRGGPWYHCYGNSPQNCMNRNTFAEPMTDEEFAANPPKWLEAPARPAGDEPEGDGWPQGWCSSCDRMTSRGCVISGRPACDKCGDWLIFNGVHMPNRRTPSPADENHKWLGCENLNGQFVTTCSCGWVYQDANYSTSLKIFVNHWGNHISSIGAEQLSYKTAEVERLEAFIRQQQLDASFATDAYVKLTAQCADLLEIRKELIKLFQRPLRCGPMQFYSAESVDAFIEDAMILLASPSPPLPQRNETYPSADEIVKELRDALEMALAFFYSPTSFDVPSVERRYNAAIRQANQFLKER